VAAEIVGKGLNLFISMWKHYLILLLSCSLFNNTIVNACQCYSLSFQEDSDNADLIFRGIVLNKKDSISISKVFYTFKVKEVWKGYSPTNVTIETNFGGLPAVQLSLLIANM
jgi:hypothetical protein